MIIHGTVYKDGYRRLEIVELRRRDCPYCNFWACARPDLRHHIKNKHPGLPQYRRRPKEGWYDQSIDNG